MEFSCKVNIVDAMMGTGKSSAAINYINSADEDEKFLVITPYLTEITRYKEACEDRHFKEPNEYIDGRKLTSLKDMLSKGINICSTHALFRRFDREAIDICQAMNYTLIMDEVTDVVSEYELTKADHENLMEKYVEVDEETHLLKWRDDQMNYTGKFSEEKRLCDLHSLAYYGGSIMLWMFPVEAFNAFRNIYIMTYMFNAQMQRYYYDYYGLPYRYLYITGDNIKNFRFTDDPLKQRVLHENYMEKIHILDHDKMNSMGESDHAFSKAWYSRNQNNVLMKKLKNNIRNYFNHIRTNGTADNMWTTFVDYKSNLEGKGYTKGFLALNARGTNLYCNKTSIAYMVNLYMNPVIRNFFNGHGIEVSEDDYALSEMLQFIWRSAIRNGQEIWCYIPSKRMRTLFQKWICENSVQ